MLLQAGNRTRILFLILAIVQVLGMGCATTKEVVMVPKSSYVERYNEQNIQGVTPIEAKTFVAQILYMHPLQLNDDRINVVNDITSINITDNTNIVFTGKFGWSISVLLDGLEYVDIIGDHNNIDNTYIKFGNYTLGKFNEGNANKLANALFALKKVALYEPIRREESKFEDAVQTYRNARAKPVLSEDARKFSIQAESAINEKSFNEAADLYKKALNICPWWPEAHFNRSIVLSEIGDLKTAIFEMKRYLRLSPDAPNARAAQDKIYVWERKVEQQK